MAQSGYTPISLYYSSTATNVPLAANLVAGELAINTADEKLYFKNASGTVKVIASSASTVNVSSISFGTTGLTPSTGTTGAVTVAGTLVAANGGTGQSSYTTGDLLYASGSTALSKLADVATGNALISGGVGVAPSWGKVGLTTHVSGTLPVANGGTGVTTSTGSGNVVLSTSPTLVTPALGTPSSGTLTNCTGYTYTNLSGTVPTWNQNTTGSAATFTSTTQDSQFNSVGVGTAGSGTTGEIRATNNVTAYYSSDARLKENVKDVDNALDIVCAIGSKTFDWTDEYIASKGGEDGYFVQKSDFGVVAQDVQAVFPQAVRTREDGTLAVDYEKLATLSFGAIKQLLARVEALEAK